MLPRGMRSRGRSLLFGSVAGLGFMIAGTSSTVSRAAPLESVSAECRAQVEKALRALAPAFARKTRRVSSIGKGSLEHAVASYAPPRFHAVDEGALPAPHDGARCPQDMASVGSRFCVDRYEGSVVERLADGTTRPHSPYHPLPPSDGIVYLARSTANAVPQGYVSAAQAQRACNAVGKRLCTPVEWRVACAGNEGYVYPYGQDRVDGKCHDHGVTPMLTFHAAALKRGWGLAELNDPRNNQLEGTVEKTGTHAECVNDVGAYDMVGNLHEWTSDPNGTFQGGYWLDTSQHGDGCAYRTISHGFDYRDYSTGFRCCRDVDAEAGAAPPP